MGGKYGTTPSCLAYKAWCGFWELEWNGMGWDGMERQTEMALRVGWVALLYSAHPSLEVSNREESEVTDRLMS
jgi:hypothetical protein